MTADERQPGNIPVVGGGGTNGFHAIANVRGPGVALARSGSGFGNAWWVETDFWAHNTVMFVSDFKGNDPRYSFYVLDWIDFSAHNSGGAQPSLNRNFIYPIPVHIPQLPEQRKIAEILRTWDEAINKLEALRAAKERRITSVRQHLFEAAYRSHNQLQRAKDIFETVSERARPDLPLLAVMQDIGIVRRDELDRRVAMPDGDTSSYKVVRPGDFVISLRSFEGGLEYSTITGLVSPAYTVLRPTTQLVGEYYRHFFKSRSFIGRLDKLIFGIRDGKQIAFRDFGDMHIPAPPVPEQKAQTEALGCLEADLALETNRIEALTRQKRGLMQKLLTGEWRVTVDCRSPSNRAKETTDAR